MARALVEVAVSGMACLLRVLHAPVVTQEEAASPCRAPRVECQRARRATLRLVYHLHDLRQRSVGVGLFDLLHRHHVQA